MTKSEYDFCVSINKQMDECFKIMLQTINTTPLTSTHINLWSGGLTAPSPPPFPPTVEVGNILRILPAGELVSRYKAGDLVTVISSDLSSNTFHTKRNIHNRNEGSKIFFHHQLGLYFRHITTADTNDYEQLIKSMEDWLKDNRNNESTPYYKWDDVEDYMTPVEKKCDCDFVKLLREGCKCGGK